MTEKPNRVFIQANPGFYLVRPNHDENGIAVELWKIPIVAWCFDDHRAAMPHPVTPEGIPGENEQCAIEYPAGASCRYDIPFFDDFSNDEELLEAFSKEREK